MWVLVWMMGIVPCQAPRQHGTQNGSALQACSGSRLPVAGPLLVQQAVCLAWALQYFQHLNLYAGGYQRIRYSEVEQGREGSTAGCSAARSLSELCAWVNLEQGMRTL